MMVKCDSQGKVEEEVMVELHVLDVVKDLSCSVSVAWEWSVRAKMSDHILALIAYFP